MLQVWTFFQCWDWLNFFFLFKPCYGYKLHEWEYEHLFVQHNQIIILVFTWNYDVSSCNRTTKNNSVLTNTIGLINWKGDFHLLTKITFFVVLVKRTGKIIRYLYRQDLSQPIFPWRFSNRVRNGVQANTNWQDVQEILPCHRLQYLSHVGWQGVQTGEIRTKQKGCSLNTLPNMNRSFVPVLQNLSCESGLWIFGFERMKRWWRKESKCVKLTKMAWPFLETDWVVDCSCGVQNRFWLKTMTQKTRVWYHNGYQKIGSLDPNYRREQFHPLKFGLIIRF